MSWNVWFEDAFRAWVARASPPDSFIDAVSLWIAIAEIDGPPADAYLVRDDYHWSPVPETALRVEYLAIAHDRLLIIRLIH